MLDVSVCVQLSQVDEPRTGLRHRSVTAAAVAAAATGATTAATGTTAAATTVAAAAITAAATTVATAAAGTTTAAAATTVATTTAATAATTVAAATTTFAATATAAATVGAAEASWTLFTRAGFVDNNGATSHRLTVQAIDSRLCFCIRGHFNETETLGATSFTIHHDLGRRHSTVFGECIHQILIAHGVGQIAHVKFVAHERALSK